jgi:hypothetical protein
MRNILKIVAVMAMVFVVIACATQKSETQPQNQNEYGKLLNGDLSYFAGNWVNGNNENRELKPDGTFHIAGSIWDQTASGFNASEDGFYSWVIGEEYTGFIVQLYPVGVEVYGHIVEATGDYQMGILKTDTTKVRIYIGHDAPDNAGQIYYLAVN